MEDPDIHTTITVRPEPTEEEMAAIATVVTMLVSTQPSSGSPARLSEDRWRIAGRRDAQRASSWPPIARHDDW